MKLYRVTFETVYWHMGVLPLFFHPQYEVEAKDEDEAKEKAQEAFNSHPDNMKLERKIVNVEELIRFCSRWGRQRIKTIDMISLMYYNKYSS